VCKEGAAHARDRIKRKNNGRIRSSAKRIKGKIGNLKFQLAVGKLTDHTAITKTKRDIARVLTVLRERV